MPGKLRMASLLFFVLVGTWQFDVRATEIEFKTHRIYSDNMVLQREKNIVITGNATAGSIIEGEFAGEKRQTVADPRNFWRLVFPALAAGGPYEMRLKSGEQLIAFQNILIGDVWFCSGQSNMQMPIISSSPVWSVQNCENEIKDADHPEIRIFDDDPYRTMNHQTPQSDLIAGNWNVCTPETMRSFSGTAYFFGRELQKKLKIPIGLVECAWGGTPIETWISADAYQKNNRRKELELLALAHATSDAERSSLSARVVAGDRQRTDDWLKRFYQFAPERTEFAQRWRSPGFDDSMWEETLVPGTVARDYDGILWFRKHIEIPEHWSGQTLRLELGAIDDCDETFFNGTAIGATTTATPNYWSSTRCYEVPGDLVRGGGAVIAVRVADFYADAGLKGEVMQLCLPHSGEQIDLTGTWRSAIEFKVDLSMIGQRPSPSNLNFDANFPTALFNGMVAPWRQFPMRGFLWYQGENNAGDYRDYLELFPMLIADWRAQWQDDTMPFLWVQLAPFVHHIGGETKPQYVFDPAHNPPSDEAWSGLREVQTAALRLPLTGQAVLIDDNSSPYDIHPRNKQLVGSRLASEALRLVYGQPNGESSYFDQMEIQGNQLLLRFSPPGKALRLLRGDRPGALAIAGADGNFVWAEARIEGDCLRVWSNDVKHPTQVRYAWSNYPYDANLGNVDGFPVAPFRTDQPAYLIDFLRR